MFWIAPKAGLRIMISDLHKNKYTQTNIGIISDLSI